MNSHRFDMMWRNVQCIHQLDRQDEVTSHEAHQWKLIEEFVTYFNYYNTNLFSPLDLICADDSIFRWYGQGGN